MNVMMKATVVVASVLVIGASPIGVGAQERERFAEVERNRGRPPPEARFAPAEPNHRLTGSYVLGEPLEAARQRVERGIARAVARMNFITRGFGGSRLRAANPIRRHMRTEVVGSRVTIEYGDTRYTTRDGEWRTVRDPNGNPVRLRQSVRGNRIEQVFRSPDGTKRTIYRFSRAGDNVRLDIRVTSPRLPDPMEYTLRYRRASGESFAGPGRGPERRHQREG